MTPTTDLAARVGEHDSGDQLEAALSLPDHLRDALWRVSSAKLSPMDSTGLLVCGMGGSAIGGDLAAAAMGTRLIRPLDVIRGYGVPSWTPPDRVIANGCNYLMMRASQETAPFNIRTIVSLNTLMIDGTGMCGVCRLTVHSSTKFACVDGPHFDGHEVDWNELAKRRKAYLAEETQLLHSSAAQ